MKKLIELLADLQSVGYFSDGVCRKDIDVSPLEVLRKIKPEYILHPQQNPDEIIGETVATRHMIGSHRYTRLYDTRDMINESQGFARSISGLGILDTDLLAYHRTLPNLGYALFKAAVDSGCSLMPLNSEDSPYDNIHGMYDLGATAWMCHENDLLSYVYSAADNDISFRDLRMIVGMTRFSEYAKSRARAVVGSQIDMRMILMDASFGIIGFQCENCAADEYRINAKNHFTELVDTEGNVVSGRGELVTTNMCRRTVPVVRARTGLIAEFVDETSDTLDPGSGGPRIRIKGRIDREVKIGDVTIRMSDLEKIPERARSASNRPVVTLRKTLVSTDEVSIHSPFHQDPTFRNLVQQTIADDGNLQNAISMESGHLVFEPYVGIDAALGTSSGVIDLRAGAPVML